MAVDSILFPALSFATTVRLVPAFWASIFTVNFPFEFAFASPNNVFPLYT